MPEFNQTEQEMMLNVPESNWYQLSVACGHTLYTRVRLKYEKFNRQYHNIQCPLCEDERKRDPKSHPTSWVQVDTVKAATDGEVSNVLSALAFVLPRRIMRLDYGGGNSGNPFPYTTRERDY